MYDHTPTRFSPLTAFSLPIILALFGLLIVLVSGAAAPPENAAPATPAGVTPAGVTPAGVTMTDAEKSFGERLTGATLTGRFTVDGDAKPPKEERYEIVSATKTTKEDWIIVAKFGPQNLKIPVPVKIHWADDAPVLGLTDLTIPGMGTFTSRVMFHENRYAGTWQHGEKGGHLFGSIVKSSEAKE